MALQISPANLLKSGRLGLQSSAPGWAPVPASFPAFAAPINERASSCQQLSAHCQQQVLARPAIDWNTRLLFGVGKGITIKDVDKDTFWPAVEAAGDKLVVVDVYTRWCGPCRMIYPKLVNLSGKYTDVIFLKLDCIPENKPITSKLGVGILPTFKIFKNKFLVSEVKGAKIDELVQKIEKARAC